MTPAGVPAQTLRVAVVRGDGIGPEVVDEALKVLHTVARTEAFSVDIEEFDLGAERYLATGELVTAETLDRLQQHDAILFGAVGDPRVAPRVLERGILFELCRHFAMDISVRPFRAYAEGLSPLKRVPPHPVDGVIVREAAEDVFALPGSSLRLGGEDEVSVGSVIFTRDMVERTLRHGFELASTRSASTGRAGRTARVTVVDQSNAASVYEIWPRTLDHVAADYPQVEAEHEAPDAFAMRLIREPERYDIVVTSWMLGGIFADIAATLVGGLGLSGSARLSSGSLSLFEPTHGSAPRHAGRGVASPIGAIEALRLLLEHVGHAGAAARVGAAVSAVLGDGSLADVSTSSGVSTQAQGDMIAQRIESLSGEDR